MNVVSRANQFILGQNVYTYMVNVVSRANINVYTYMNVVSRANQFILGQNVYTYMVKMFILIQVNVVSRSKCLYLYGECCEESNYQNVYTYMVNVVSRAIIKMFILRW